MDRPDSEVIQAVLQGDTDSFELLIKKYQPRLFGIARRYAADEGEAEDIVQESFIKAFQKLSSYRSEAPFEHWLMRVAVRTSYDFLRRRRRSRETMLSQLTEPEMHWLEALTATTNESEDNARAAREIVTRLLQQLPAASRLVLTLLELEDRSVKEVAALTGWSVPLVKVRAFRARRVLRKILEKDKKLV